ncbi:hypothetical protein EDC04DRAFT_2598458 [Pisolithus marmoratus]|nr:hypothetical protein EDC04DRAFT_2598458 [Pisolithus marmoratus]
MLEHQEQLQCHEIKAQREHKCLQCHQQVEAGSKHDEPKGSDDQSGIKDDDGDEDNGTQFSSHAVPTKLSASMTKEHLMYSKSKIPKALPVTIDINREIASSDNEDIEGPFVITTGIVWDATKLHNILPGICMRLYEMDAFIPVQDPSQHGAEVTISTHVIATTIREYKDGSTMEDESD